MPKPYQSKRFCTGKLRDWDGRITMLFGLRAGAVLFGTPWAESSLQVECGLSDNHRVPGVRALFSNFSLR